MVSVHHLGYGTCSLKCSITGAGPTHEVAARAGQRNPASHSPLDSSRHPCRCDRDSEVEAGAADGQTDKCDHSSSFKKNSCSPWGQTHSACKNGSWRFFPAFLLEFLAGDLQPVLSISPLDEIFPKDDPLKDGEAGEMKPCTGGRVGQARQDRKLFGVQRLPQLASLQNVVKLDVAKLFVERHTRRGHRSGVFLAPRPSKLFRDRTGAFTPSVAAHPEHGTDNLER